MAFVGYFLLAGAWAVALPTNGTYDEKQHLVRAYAVWTGQFLPHARSVEASGLPSDAINGPRSLLPDNVDCAWNPRPAKPASCQRPVTDRTIGLVPTTAGRYSPVYYLAVGLPLRISPDETGLIWARLLSAFWSALLLAAAAGVAARLGNKLLLVALVLVSTPLVMNLNGSVNPNGLEISAGVLFFTALLAALRSPAKHLVVLAGVAGTLLLTVRHLGPFLFGVAVLACLLIAGWERTRALLRRRDAWVWLGVPWVAGAAFFLFWLLASRVTDIPPDRPMLLSVGGILDGIVDHRAKFYVAQVIGQFGYGETTVSPFMILFWYGLLLALVGPAFWFAGRNVRLAMVGIVVICALVLVGLELYFVPRVGWYGHSRYVLPLGVGVVIAAAYVDRYAAWLKQRGWIDQVALALATWAVPLELYALARVMTRFQVGIDARLAPFGGSWQPASGPVLPLLACLAGGLLLTFMVRSGSVRPAPEREPATDRVA